MDALNRLGIIRREQESGQKFSLHDVNVIRVHSRNLYYGLLFCAMTGFIGAIVANEITAVEGHNKNIVEGLRCCISFFTLLLIILLKMYWNNQFRLARARNAVMERDTLWTSGYGSLFLLELLVCCLHLPPFVPLELTMECYSGELCTYSGDSLAAFVMSARLYLFLRFIRDHLSVSNPRAAVVTALNQFEVDFKFALKSLLDTRPAMFVSVASLSLLLWSSFLMRLCEMPVASSDSYHLDSSLSLWNSVWLIITTVTTVGYGEIYPNTYCGRGVASVSLVVGTVLTALLVAVVSQALRLTERENRVFQVLEEKRLRVERSEMAVRAVQASWRHHAARRDMMRVHSQLALREASSGAKVLSDQSRLNSALQSTPSLLGRSLSRRGTMGRRGSTRRASEVQVSILDRILRRNSISDTPPASADANAFADRAAELSPETPDSDCSEAALHAQLVYLHSVERAKRRAATRAMSAFRHVRKEHLNALEKHELSTMTVPDLCVKVEAVEEHLQTLQASLNAQFTMMHQQNTVLHNSIAEIRSMMLQQQARPS